MSVAPGARAAAIRDARIAGRPLRILDAHHHFWDLEGGGHWPWIQDQYNDEFFLGDYNAMRKTFLPAHYLAATAGWDVVGTVHCEAERSRAEQVEENVFLQQLSDATAGRFPAAAVAHVYFTQPDLDEVLMAHAAHPLVRGVRSKPVISRGPGQSVAGEPGSLQDPHWLAGLAKLEQHGLSWDLRVPFHHLAEAADVVASIPGTSVIVNHCGLPLDRSDEGLSIWRDGMRRLAALPNTVVKVSELGLARNRWDRASNETVVRETLDVFGPERSMFASNLPVATLTAPTFDDVMDTVLTGAADLNPAELDQLFSGTAARVYDVDLDALDARADA